MEKTKIEVVNRTTFLYGSIAFILSWVINHSIWWGLLHFVLGEFYIIYWLIKYSTIENFIRSCFMT